MPGAYVPPVHHKPAAPKHEPKKWDGDHHVPDGKGSFTNHDPVQQPPVPKDGGSGKKTSVHTPSMDQFASNIETLIPYLQRAGSALDKISVSPGVFYHANVMRGKVTGQNGDSGIKDAYEKVLNDLANGLTDLCHGIRLMSKKYQSLEDANKMTSKELQDYMYDANSDISAISQDTMRVS